MDASRQSLSSLYKKLELLQSRTADLFPLMRGSVVHIGTVTKRPTYSLNMKGKTKIVYLGEAKEAIATKWIENYREQQKIMDEMTLINIEIIRRMNVPTKTENQLKK